MGWLLLLSALVSAVGCAWLSLTPERPRKPAPGRPYPVDLTIVCTDKATPALERVIKALERHLPT